MSGQLRPLREAKRKGTACPLSGLHSPGRATEPSCQQAEPTGGWLEQPVPASPLPTSSHSYPGNFCGKRHLVQKILYSVDLQATKPQIRPRLPIRGTSLCITGLAPRVLSTGCDQAPARPCQSPRPC